MSTPNTNPKPVHSEATAQSPGVINRTVPASGLDLWRLTHRALRGRYMIAGGLAVCGALVGGFAGMSYGKRLYSATGLVRIASVLPQVLKETDQNRSIAMFDGFMQSQSDIITRRELLQAAMTQGPWQEVQLSGKSMSEADFAGALKVDARNRSEFLRVSFTHKDPVIANAAVESVLAAYTSVFEREQRAVDEPRIVLLNQRRDTLKAEYDRIDQAAQRISNGRSLAELSALYSETTERRRKLSAELTEIHIAIAGGLVSGAKLNVPVRSPLEQIEDTIIQNNSLEQSRLERQLQEARDRGLLSEHPVVIRLEAAIRSCEELTTRYATARSQRVVIDEPAQPVLSATEREAALNALALGSQDALRELATAREVLVQLEEQRASLARQIADTESRLDTLATEASMANRLTVTSGGQPLTALIDSRPKMASAGSFAGFTGTLGLLVFAGTMRRRYRAGSEVVEDLRSMVQCITVVPEVSDSKNSSSSAAHSLHDLRIHLQPSANGTSRTYLVTSPCGGEGKSSLATSLALSFAAAGFRTLLVDADLASTSLSKGFDAGFTPGLTDALSGDAPSPRQLVAGMSFLSAGRSASQATYGVRPATLIAVLDNLRRKFDVIILDSDSLLSATTASMLTPLVDGVILAIARGQAPHAVTRAINSVHSMGGYIAAAVFNRASIADVDVVTQPAASTNADPRPRSLPERLQRFGPLVSSMLASIRLSRAEDLDLLPSIGAAARVDIVQPSLQQTASLSPTTLTQSRTSNAA